MIDRLGETAIFYYLTAAQPIDFNLVELHVNTVWPNKPLWFGEIKMPIPMCSHRYNNYGWFLPKHEPVILNWNNPSWYSYVVLPR